jgi:hypothetical protein
MGKIVIDIWTGERHQEHCARFIRNYKDALVIARDELEAGNLVNLRNEVAWGDYEDFDNRTVILGRH